MSIQNSTLQQIVLIAYGIQSYQLDGAPGWINSAQFSIVAKAPAQAEGAPRLSERQEGELALARLRTLLRDRFQLEIRREFKDAAVFALVVGKGGHRMKENPQHGGLSSRRPGELVGEGAPINPLIQMLSVVLGRPVIDETGLTGTYDFRLEWSPDIGSSGLGNKPAVLAAQKAEEAGVSLPDPGGPSIFNAIQEQLGLRLESKKAPVETIVVERIERPSGN
jgi:uncharacterized protein (TIGR03435 family)